MKNSIEQGVRLTLAKLTDTELVQFALYVEGRIDPRKQPWYERVAHLYTEGQERRLLDALEKEVWRIVDEREKTV